MADSQPIDLQIKNGIAFCVLNNPPQNVMNRNFFARLRQVIVNELPRLPVHGLIITGAERHFSSGADVGELLDRYRASNSKTNTGFLSENLDTFQRIEKLPYPTVAAINGCCLGAGLELALACTHRIASVRAVFSLPECSFGIMPGCGGTVRLARLIGSGRAASVILSGRTIPADEALCLGIIDAIIDKRELMNSAIAIITSKAHTTLGRGI